MQNKKVLVGLLLAAVFIVAVFVAVKVNKKNSPLDKVVVVNPSPTPVAAPTSIFNVKPLQSTDVKDVMPQALFSDKDATIVYLNQVTPKDSATGMQYSLRYTTTQTLTNAQKTLTAALVKEGYKVGKANEQKDLIIFGASKDGKPSVTITMLPEGKLTRVETNVVIK